MQIKDFKESLDYMFKAELTPFVWGHAGIGKTESIKQYAKEKGYKFFPFYLGTMSDSGDILGLAEFSDRGNGTKATNFAPPGWMLDMIDYCNENPESGAVIFLDEFNRARRDIMQGMFSLALDKTFHTIKFPKNCHIVAAGNPPTDEYFTTDVNETALMARFVHIKLEPSVQEWVEYAKKTDVDSNLIGFIQDQPNLLEEKHSEFQLKDFAIKVDRRAYSRLNKLFKLNTPQHLMESLMPGIIGLERTVAYKQFLKNIDKPLTGEQVLKHDQPNLIEKWSNVENVAASFLNITCDNLVELLTKRDAAKELLKDDEKSNLMWFLNTIPKDIGYRVIHALVILSNKLFLEDFFGDSRYENQIADLTLAAKGKK
jgi:AAA domain (dynein-related subfamily)